MHLPNRPFEDNEWDQIRALNVRDYVDLHHFRSRWPELKQRQPDARLHARVDVRGALGDPELEAADLARQIAENGAAVATWRYRNEPNLESPGVTPEQWRDWLTAFGQEVKRRAPSASVYAPAVSPSPPGAWLAWLDATVEGARAGGLDGIDAHAYGNPDQVREVVDAHRSRWPGRLLVTEHNFGAGQQYDLARYAADLPEVIRRCGEREVEAVCLFIWQWANPDMHLPTSVDVRGSAIEALVAGLPRAEPPEEVEVAFRPPASGLDNEKLKAYGEWATARLAANEDPRDAGAFVAHLRALGADWRAPTAYGFPDLAPDGW